MSDMTFHGVRMGTAPGLVMTPRPASEQLVVEALARVGGRAARVVDVGTGSGAIAIALAVQAPALEVWATDLSAAAVAVAQANVERHGVADRVHVRQGDLLAPVRGKIDLVVANLPYLPAHERIRHPELSDEPVSALFGCGDGLGAYSRLLSECEARLRGGGALVIQFRRGVLTADRDDLAALGSSLMQRAAVA